MDSRKRSTRIVRTRLQSRQVQFRHGTRSGAKSSNAFRLVGESAADEDAATSRDKWLRENAEAISEYNDLIARLSRFGG
jgi:post-segregation antitoxin (ccd killing protein)